MTAKTKNGLALQEPVGGMDTRRSYNSVLTAPSPRRNVYIELLNQTLKGGTGAWKSQNRRCGNMLEEIKYLSDVGDIMQRHDATDIYNDCARDCEDRYEKLGLDIKNPKIYRAMVRECYIQCSEALIERKVEESKLEQLAKYEHYR